MSRRIVFLRRLASFVAAAAVLNLNITPVFAISLGSPPVAQTVSEVTRYVGDLYEEAASRQTKFIYVGSTRVAGVSNGTISYYHPNHLGSANVVTDAAGVLQELLEYKPYGELAKDVKSTPEKRAWHQFTGKPLDDKTGLYYYGARYYDPSLGRFVTADPTIQHPNDPQDLNRYAYTRNNPVNLVDPTGFGWFKKFISKWAGLFGLAGAVVKGATTGDWSTAQSIGTAAASSAIFSWGNPFAIAASVLSAGFMDTPPGHQFSRFMSEDVMDNVFGMRPRAAYVAGNMMAYAIVTSAIYIAITPASYTGPDLRDPKNRNGIENYKAEIVKKVDPRTANQMAQNGGKDGWLRQGRIASQNGWSDWPILGKITNVLGINHTAVVVETPAGFFDSAFNTNLVNPFVHGDLWAAPWTGMCHQVSFTTLVEKGGASGWQAFNAVAKSGGWTSYVTSAVYGVRADFGGVGLINYAIDKNLNN